MIGPFFAGTVNRNRVWSRRARRESGGFVGARVTVAVRRVDGTGVTNGAGSEACAGVRFWEGPAHVHGRTVMRMPKEPGPDLGLVGDGAPLRLERRRVPRYAASGGAMADVVGCDGSHAIASVQLSDSSACGLGILTEKPIERGAFVRVFIGLPEVPARAGVVARCVEVRDDDGERVGYRVGLDTGMVQAA